jgi:hypothetical protein
VNLAGSRGFFSIAVASFFRKLLGRLDDDGLAVFAEDFAEG